MKFKKTIVIAILGVIGMCSVARGQVVNGADHPEQIPDSTAYRLHFVAMMNSGHAEEYLRASGVTEEDVSAAVTVLSNFKKNYDALAAVYNADPETLAGNSTKTTNFVAARESLVRSVRAELGTALAEASVSNFDAHIQSIKGSIRHNVDPLTVEGPHDHMRMLNGGGGQGAGCNPMTAHYDTYLSLAPSSVFTYTQVPLTTSMFTYYNLTGYNPSEIADGNLTNYGWHTDASTPGAQLSISLTSAQPVSKATIYADSSGYAGNYSVQYSDDLINWTTVATNFIPNQAGANSIVWAAPLAHRYWTLYLTNTPGPGAWLGELQFYTTNIPTTTIYSSMLLEGYTYTGGSNCFPTTHHGRVTNNMSGNNPNPVVGGNVSPSSYISTQANDSVACILGDCGILDINSITGEIICSISGIFFNTGGGGGSPFPTSWLKVQQEIATTILQSDHGIISTLPDGRTWWTAHQVCSARSQPPDLNANAALDKADTRFPIGWFGGSYCFRGILSGGAKSPWICGTDVLGVFGYPGGISVRTFLPDPNIPGDAVDCTNKDKNITGLPWWWPFGNWPLP